MLKKKIPVYFVPGLAAGSEIFNKINLSTDLYDVTILEWLMPNKKETLAQYAQRMAERIKEEDAILIGVSFGGVVVQEMSLFLNLKRLIIISSVKTKYELPRRLKLARKTRAYKLVPTRIVLSSDDLTKYAIGSRSRKRLKIYNDYLHVRDRHYLKWAIKQMVCWNRKTEIPGVVHLHGDADIVFPIKNINNCKIIKGGTHIMIINKSSKIKKTLEAIFEN